jgi:hypothetical protein
LPITLTPVAASQAPACTVMLPWTTVPFKVQVAFWGTRTLSTVIAPSGPVQEISSAQAGVATNPEASRPADPARTAIRTVREVLIGSSVILGAEVLPGCRSR